MYSRAEDGSCKEQVILAGVNLGRAVNLGYDRHEATDYFLLENMIIQ